jgi:hypothetical protein
MFWKTNAQARCIDHPCERMSVNDYGFTALLHVRRRMAQMVM